MIKIAIEDLIKEPLNKIDELVDAVNELIKKVNEIEDKLEHLEGYKMSSLNLV